MRTLKFSAIAAIFTISLTCGLSCHTASAQTRSRSFIREQISKQGQCRNVAITKYNGDLMLYGSNGWAANGCPSDLTEALSELNDEGKYIDDVQLTEDGSWLILFGNNGFRWNDIPYSLEKTLREYNSRGEVVNSVSFNDDGDWIIVSKEHIRSSNSNIQEWIAEGMEQYGTVWTACVTDDAIVVVYEYGFQTAGDIPDTLMKALKKTSIDIFRLKIAGNAWFFSDGVSEYDYNM